MNNINYDTFKKFVSDIKHFNFDITEGRIVLNSFINNKNIEINFRVYDNFILMNDLIIFKDKIISNLEVKTQELLDCLKPYLYSANYKNTLTYNKDNIKNNIKKINNKVYFYDNLVCEIQSNFIVHYKFDECFYLSNKNILGDKIKFNYYDEPKLGWMSIF